MPISATIAGIERRTDDIFILHLMPEVPFAFHAGQYLHITGATFDARPYSIANAPARDGTITLHIRNMGSGVSQWLGTQAKMGDVVQIDGPFGTMTPQAATARPVYMIAGGMGIVPMLALAQEIIRKGITEEGISLIYGARTAEDIYCRRELEALVSSGELTLHEGIGAHTPDMVLAQLAPNLNNHTVYVSGPDPMLFNILPAIKRHGLQMPNLYTDMDLAILTGKTS